MVEDRSLAMSVQGCKNSVNCIACGSGPRKSASPLDELFGGLLLAHGH